MASDVSICNAAMTHLGENRITALDEDSVAGRACNEAYERTRDWVLRKHPWSCASKREALAADTDAPIGDAAPAVQYSLPSDFIRLLPRDPLENRNDLDWQIEGRKLLTSDSAPLYIRYVYRVTDPNEMDPLLQEAIAIRIAINTCKKITGSTSLMVELRNLYKDAIAEAKRANAIENVSQDPPEDTWLTCRA